MIDSVIFILDFIERHNGAITAISTFVLVVVTGIYVYLTHEIVKESEKTRKTMFLPNIKPTLKLQSLVHAFLEIRNVGPGAARNVQVKYWSDFNKQTPAIWKTPLFSPNETQSLTLVKNNQMIYELEDLKELGIVIFEIEYVDPWEEKHLFTYPLDLKDLIENQRNESGTIPFVATLDEKIENHLKAISDKLTNVNSIKEISDSAEILTETILVDRVKSFLKDNLKPGAEITSSEIGNQLGLGQIKTYEICSKIKKSNEYSFDTITTGRNIYYSIKIK